MKEFHCEAVKAGERSMSGGETCLSVGARIRNTLIEPSVVLERTN